MCCGGALLCPQAVVHAAVRPCHDPTCRRNAISQCPRAAVEAFKAAEAKTAGVGPKMDLCFSQIR